MGHYKAHTMTVAFLLFVFILNLPSLTGAEEKLDKWRDQFGRWHHVESGTPGGVCAPTIHDKNDAALIKAKSLGYKDYEFLSLIGFRMYCEPDRNNLRRTLFINDPDDSTAFIAYRLLQIKRDANLLVFISKDSSSTVEYLAIKPGSPVKGNPPKYSILTDKYLRFLDIVKMTTEDGFELLLPVFGTEKKANLEENKKRQIADIISEICDAANNVNAEQRELQSETARSNPSEEVIQFRKKRIEEDIQLGKKYQDKFKKLTKKYFDTKHCKSEE